MRKMGKVVLEAKKYYIIVDNVKQEIASNIIPASRIKPLVGKEVEVELADPVMSLYSIFDQKLPKRPRIICYLPRPDIFNPHVLEELEFAAHVRELADKLLAEKAISEKVHQQLMGLTR
jgi:hypothetical protein